MTDQREAFVMKFVDEYVENWARNISLTAGVKYFDDKNSVTRTLARTLAETIWDNRERLLEL